MDREVSPRLSVPRFVPVVTPLIKGFLRLGIPMGPNILLTTRGRKTGKSRTTPVALMKLNERKFLLATFGEVNWVRNLRTSGEAQIGKGGRRETFRVNELSPETAAPLFKEILTPYLNSRMMRSFLSTGYNLGPKSSDEDFMREALRHPMFELISQAM
jgi:deazaflavin-dependent oxidoreductase (nitroreductase family)